MSDNLPPLPEPAYTGDRDDYFTADQMRAYGEACAAAEREACAKVCEGTYGVNLALDDEEAYYGRAMAASIRARGET